MLNLLKLAIIALIISACNHDYTNQDHYSLSVGEKIEIFYSTNSCCQYCVTNESSLNVVQLVNDITVEQEDNCDGCNYTGAFVFKGLRKGVDTVYLNMSTAKEDCYNDSLKKEYYVITVR